MSSHILTRGAVVAARALVLGGCDQGLSRVNVNPNAVSATSATASMIFPTAVYEVVGDPNGSDIALPFGTLWAGGGEPFIVPAKAKNPEGGMEQLRIMLSEASSKNFTTKVKSLTAFNGSPFISAYGATKAFNLILGEGLAYELGKLGIDVTVCCAGVITTPNFEEGYTGKASIIEPPKMSPEAVARSAVEALGRRSVFVPGRMNSFLSFIMRRLMSRRATVRLMAKTVEDLSIEDRQTEQHVG